MTTKQLRDHFAGQALPSIIVAGADDNKWLMDSAANLAKRQGVDAPSGKSLVASVALLAYGVADAMLAERAK